MKGLAALSPILDALSESEEREFSEITPEDKIYISGRAVRLVINGEFHWIPLSQMRQIDGQLHVSNWLLKNKGIEP